jgi:hypothetical protein
MSSPSLSILRHLLLLAMSKSDCAAPSEEVRGPLRRAPALDVPPAPPSVMSEVTLCEEYPPRDLSTVDADRLKQFLEQIEDGYKVRIPDKTEFRC